jgi:hypothetical protein
MLTQTMVQPSSLLPSGLKLEPLGVLPNFWATLIMIGVLWSSCPKGSLQYKFIATISSFRDHCLPLAISQPFKI